MNDVLLHPNRGTKTNRHRLTASLLASLILSGGLLSGQVPDGPPKIKPSSFQTFVPTSLGNRVIPPFNAADPGSTVLAVGQMAELMVVLSQPDNAEIQWVRDGQTLSGRTRESVHIAEVSQEDTGIYRVDVTINGAENSSSEIEFQVLTLAEIDDVLVSWSNRFFTFEEVGDPAISGDAADPDLDGLSNLLEYFFGSSPTKYSAPPELNITDSIDSEVSFVYSRVRERTDLKYTVEGSNGLKEWVPLSVTETTVTPIDESTESVEVEVNWVFDPPFPRFLRLVIEPANP